MSRKTDRAKTSGKASKSHRKNKFSDEEVLKAIDESAGIKTVICKRLGCSRGTLYKYLQERRILQEAYEDERETVKDMIESKVYKLIREDNPTMIIFAAKTLLRDRGFIENPNGAGDQRQTIIITRDEVDY